MKRSWGITCVGVLVLLCGMALESSAESARVRCRVRDGRVRIQLDGRALAPGVYKAQVLNLTANKLAETAVGKEATATVAAPNVDLDFDSTAQVDDLDSPIAGDFAVQNDLIQAYVVRVLGNLSVASAATQCTR